MTVSNGSESIAFMHQVGMWGSIQISFSISYRLFDFRCFFGCATFVVISFWRVKRIRRPSVKAEGQGMRIMKLAMKAILPRMISSFHKWSVNQTYSSM